MITFLIIRLKALSLAALSQRSRVGPCLVDVMALNASSHVRIRNFHIVFHGYEDIPWLFRRVSA